MNSSYRQFVLTPLVAALLLVGCNSNDDDSVGAKPTSTTVKTLTVTPSLGKILNAKVRLRNAANNASLGETTTGTTGKATFNVPATVNTVIAEVVGGNGATYFDEAKNAMVPMPASTIIRTAASLTNTNSEIGVTALTEAMVKRAETLAGAGSIVPQLNAAKAAVESAFGITDILKAPTLVGSQADIANLGSTPAGQYAMRLASLAKIAAQNLGSTEAAPAAKMAQAIAQDLADGDVDGSGNTGTLPYDLATFAAQYQAQVIALVNDLLANAAQGGFDVAKLQALLSFVQNNPIELKLTPPAIPFALTGFTPVSAAVGAEVTITGTSFVADPTKMKVTFANNVQAQIMSATATSLVVKVPDGAVSGKITVTNLNTNESKTSVADFTVSETPVAFNVTGFGPGSAAVGGQVTILGTGFDSDKFHMLVKFSPNIAAEIVSASATKLVVKVPQGAVTGTISVTNTITEQTVTTTNQVTISNVNPPPATAWATRQSPSGSMLTSVAFGAGKFVAVGMRNAIISSTDGISWQEQVPADKDYFQANSVIYDGSQFVMVGDVVFGKTVPPLVATSPDGVTWTRRSLVNNTGSSIFSLTDVAAGGGKLTAVGGDVIFSSSDSGVTWASERSVFSLVSVENLAGVAANATTRIVVGRDTSSKGFILRHDGSAWAVAKQDLAVRLNDVIWTGNQFVAVGVASDAKSIITSSDGITWTEQALPAEAIGYSLNDVVWTGTKLYAVGDKMIGPGKEKRIILSSSDGITWVIEHESEGANFTSASLAGIAASEGVIVTLGGGNLLTRQP
ncbi:MAG: IPT/TIG domain-containing protein [Pseudomonadales bacterium]|nr:IPT/TIG domain-containing protein [Pseudomonadales bacterium]